MLPEKPCQCKQKRPFRRQGTRTIAGVSCILVGLLLLLLCAPGWLVALIIAGLLFMLGLYLLGGC